MKANDNERIHRLVEENTQWRIRFEGLEQRLREMSEEDTNTDRHRLQISVLQERIVKQEQQLQQLQFRKSPTPQNSVNQSLNESVITKISNVKSIETKLRENIQRLVKSVSLFTLSLELCSFDFIGDCLIVVVNSLVQIPRRPNGEKRISFQVNHKFSLFRHERNNRSVFLFPLMTQEGPPMPDIRRTVKTLQELVCKLDDVDDC